MLIRQRNKIICGRLNLNFSLLVVVILFLQLNILYGGGHVAKIGMISMEATHSFKSSLLTKINAVKPLIEEAGGQNLDLVAIPEAYFRGSGLMVDIQDLSDSPVLDSIKIFAKNNQINVIFQVVEEDSGQAFNTAVVVNRKGEFVGKYRKVKLPPEESELTAGKTYKVFDLDFAKVGVLICWDGWFTEPAKILAEKGAEIIVIPTWCNIKGNMETITAENGIPVAYAVLRINCGAGEDNLPSSIYDHHGDLISSDHMVGQNKIGISTVMLGNYKNLAFNKNITASESNDENPVINVVDGKYSTERDAPVEIQTNWKTNTFPQWIEIDLGSQYDVDRVSIAMFEPDGYEFLIEGKTDENEYFLLSDSIDKYETILEHGIAGSEITTSRFGVQGPIKTRFVRITINSLTKSDIQINEIKVFGYPKSDPTEIGKSEIMRIPAKSKMLPNYPNPFNPETIIQYVLQENSNVELIVYNIKGQIVKELVKKSMPAGEHMVKWNGENNNSEHVSSGVYIAKIEMKSGTGKVIMDSKKIVLIR